MYAGEAARQQAVMNEVQAMRVVERRHYAWFRQQRDVYYNGRDWHRITETRRPPNDVSIELLTMDGSAWWTQDPPNPDWQSWPK